MPPQQGGQCPFCQLISNPDQLMIVGETDNFYAWLEVNPRAKGHTMIVPKEHTENLLELPMDQWSEAFELVREVVERAKKGLDADGVSVAVNIEEAGGQMLPHAYIIVFPRFESDENAGTPTGAIFPQQEELQQQLDSIQNDMSSVSVNLGQEKKEAHPESQNFKDTDEIDQMLKTSDIAKKAKQNAKDPEKAEESNEESEDGSSSTSEEPREVEGLEEASKQEIFQELLNRYGGADEMCHSGEFQQILDSANLELRSQPRDNTGAVDWR